MATKSKPVKHRSLGRRFLDSTSSHCSEEFGSVAWEINWYEGTTQDDWYAPRDERKEEPPTPRVFTRGFLRFSDCHRAISLDFDAGGPSQIRDRISKVDSLLLELGELRKTLMDAHEAAKRVEAPPKAKKRVK